MSAEALAQLVAYDWPGNVRELKTVVVRLMASNRTGIITPRDLPPEVPPPRGSAASTGGVEPARPAAQASAVDELYDRIVNRRESFWDAAYAPFMSRDLTREDLRTLLRRGLQQAGGNYKVLVDLFNMAPADYKRFLNFLRKHDCQVPFQRFRGAQPREDRLVAQDV
jgi:DNA-binding NtrC family response regulator